MIYNNILPFPRSYWVIPGLFLAGHVPTNSDPEISKQKIERLFNVGILRYINLQEEDEVNESNHKFPDYSSQIRQLARKNHKTIYFHRYPIQDLSIPTRETMDRILTEIDLSMSNNTPVYLHCWGGIGRTGTVVGCYLIRNKLAHKNNVIDMIQYLRRTDPKSDRSSPETDEQVKFVLNWDQ